MQLLLEALLGQYFKEAGFNNLLRLTRKSITSSFSGVISFFTKLLLKVSSCHKLNSVAYYGYLMMVNSFVVYRCLWKHVSIRRIVSQKV